MTTVTAVAASRLGSSDEGFSLVEVVVALMLTVVVMTVTAGFFVRSLTATRLMQQRQSAVAVAAQAMERVRAEPVSALSGGRDITVTGATDPAYRVFNINYTVRTTVTDCWVPPGVGSCGADSSSPNMLMYRVNINVRWTPGAGARCPGPGGQCEHTVTTLRDPSGTSTGSLREVPL